MLSGGGLLKRFIGGAFLFVKTFRREQCSYSQSTICACGSVQGSLAGALCELRRIGLLVGGLGGADCF